MKEPKGLVPVKIVSVYKQSPTVLGKLIRHDRIVTATDKVLAEDLPPDWMEYIKNAINGHAELATYKRNDVPISQDIIYNARIPGKPVAMKDGKQIKRDEDGNYTLSASKEYATRIRQVMRMKQKLLFGFGIKPIDYPVHVKCVFHIPDRRRKLVVAEQTAAILDLLQRLGVLKSATSEVVARTDGSEVKYILGEPYTLVVIRKMVEGNV